MIHQLSAFPVSIIIIGVGECDFKEMEILDGDEGLFDRGVKVPRDIV
jgi:hypothetical protein